MFSQPAFVMITDTYFLILTILLARTGVVFYIGKYSVGDRGNHGNITSQTSQGNQT
jgi:hypothetical protein